METIIKRYEEKYGYTPTIFNIYHLYKHGSLILSDKEEKALIIETLKYPHINRGRIDKKRIMNLMINRS